MKETKLSRSKEHLRTSLYKWFSEGVRLGSRYRLGGRLPFLRPVYFRLVSLLRPGVVRVETWTVYCHRSDNAVSHALRTYGTFEVVELQLIRALLRDGDYAVDVGANIGLHTLAMSSACGSHGRVLALEPDPENLRLCHRNLRANHCTNVELLPFAASDRDGLVYLYKSEENRGDHRLYDPGDDRQRVEVKTRRLEELLNERDALPVLVKIDVQGWESNAIAGAMAALRGTHPLALLTEFWSEGLIKAGSSPQEYLGLLEELELTLYEIKNDRGTLVRLDPKRNRILSGDVDTNLLGVRRLTSIDSLLSVLTSKD